MVRPLKICKGLKLIPGEQMDIQFKKKLWRKVKFRKKLKLWRLRELEVKEEFAERVNNKCYDNKDWCGLERKLLDVASEVCGYTKGKPRHFEKWWWNENVDVAVRKKRGELFMTLKQLE